MDSVTKLLFSSGTTASYAALSTNEKQALHAAIRDGVSAVQESLGGVFLADADDAQAQFSFANIASPVAATPTDGELGVAIRAYKCLKAIQNVKFTTYIDDILTKVTAS